MESTVGDAVSSESSATNIKAENGGISSTLTEVAEDMTSSLTVTEADSVADAVGTEGGASISSKITEEIPFLNCPINGWPRFKIQSFAGDFIRYPFRRGEVSTESRTGEVEFSVTEACFYKIKEKDTEGNSLVYRTPLEWLDMGVLFFSGIAGPRRDAALSGTAAPTVVDVTIVETESAVEVRISETSLAVLGADPLVWLFPSFADAREFEYFLTSLHRYAPAVFLTNDSMACGSGPVCKVFGEEVCFYNPNGRVLGAGNATHIGFVRNSMVWFRHCASMIGCERMEEGGNFLYYAAPEYLVANATFSFIGRGVINGAIEFHCPSSIEAEMLGEFASDLVHDPFHSLGLGGPGQPGFDHHRFFV